MPKSSMTKGDVVKKIRVIDVKEPQWRMAERYGLSQSALSKIEQGLRNPPIKLMEGFLRDYKINLLEYPDRVKGGGN